MPGDPLFSAIQMVGATQIMTGDGNADMKFNPADQLANVDRASIEAMVSCRLPSAPLSRGQTAMWLFNQGYA